MRFCSTFGREILLPSKVGGSPLLVPYSPSQSAFAFEEGEIFVCSAMNRTRTLAVLVLTLLSQNHLDLFQGPSAFFVNSVISFI